MCLHRLKSFGLPKSGIGYKIYRVKGKQLLTPFQEVEHKIGETYTDSSVNTLKCYLSKRQYESGYHLYRSLESAQKELRKFDCFYGYNDTSGIIIKVRYSKLVAQGIEDGGFRAIVAKKITLLEEVK